jgi:hypothetical protein
MKNPTPDFPRLTKKQLALLEEIKAEKAKLRTLSPGDPKPGVGIPELEEIHKEIDDLSVRALRSGLLRRVPAGSRSSGLFRLLFDEGIKKEDGTEEYMVLLLPSAGDFHPELPPWAVEHFLDWIQRQRLQKEGREILRETKVVGLESGMKRTKDFSVIECWEIIKWRFLELRGVKDEHGHMCSALVNEPPLNTLGEMLEKSQRIVVTNDMLMNARQQRKAEEKMRKSRTRKNSAPLDWVIEKLVEEGLLMKKISHQAFKIMLKRRWPDYPWDKV